MQLEQSLQTIPHIRATSLDLKHGNKLGRECLGPKASLGNQLLACRWVGFFGVETLDEAEYLGSKGIQLCVHLTALDCALVSLAFTHVRGSLLGLCRSLLALDDSLSPRAEVWHTSGWCVVFTSDAVASVEVQRGVFQLHPEARRRLGVVADQRSPTNGQARGLLRDSAAERATVAPCVLTPGLRQVENFLVALTDCHDIPQVVVGHRR